MMSPLSIRWAIRLRKVRPFIVLTSLGDDCWSYGTSSIFDSAFSHRVSPPYHSHSLLHWKFRAVVARANNRISSYRFTLYHLQTSSLPHFESLFRQAILSISASDVHTQRRFDHPILFDRLHSFLIIRPSLLIPLDWIFISQVSILHLILCLIPPIPDSTSLMTPSRVY